LGRSALGPAPIVRNLSAVPAAFVEIVPGIVRIPTAPASAINSYAFVEGDGSVTLVDTGLKSAPKRIYAALAELGKQPSDVNRIILTHAHSDHAGGLQTVHHDTGGRLHVHETDAEWVRKGEVPPRDKRSFIARVMAYLPDPGFAPTEVDEVITDNQLLDVAGGLRVVHTPGHTSGHVSLLHESSGVLITGDALFNWTRRISFSPRFLCTNIPLSRETAARLGEVDYEVAAFTHGPEIRDGARDKVRAFLRRRGVVR
jgi:glyoxylase-like metal-dependent hydrolase (beta-lactamase superfamily II)